jgi:hypothetical protein
LTDIVPGTLPDITVVYIEATNLDQPSLNTVSSVALTLVPAVTYNVTVVDQFGNTVPGALIESLFLREEDGTPYTATSDGSGNFTITMPVGDYAMSASCEGHFPLEFSSLDLASGTLVLEVPVGGTTDITVNNLIGTDMAYVTAEYMNGSSELVSTPPLRIVGDGTFSNNAILALVAQRYEKIKVFADGYLTVVLDNGGMGFEAADLPGLSLVADLLQEELFSTTTQMPTTTFEYKSRNPVTGDPEDQDLSGYDIVSVALEDTNDVTDVAETAGTDPMDLDVDVSGFSETVLGLADPNDGDKIVFAINHHPDGISKNRPNGYRQFSPTGGGTFRFTQPTPKQGTVMDDVFIDIPAGALDVSSFSCPAPDATLVVNILDVDTATSDVQQKAEATAIKVLEVDVHLGNCTGGLVDTSATSTDGVFGEISISMPFDVTKVLIGQFESGDVPIYTAENLAQYLAGNITTVPLTDIVFTDYTTGLVTFKVRHLSVFSAGFFSRSSGCETGGCFLKSLEQ